MLKGKRNSENNKKNYTAYHCLMRQMFKILTQNFVSWGEQKKNSRTENSLCCCCCKDKLCGDKKEWEKKLGQSIDIFQQQQQQQKKLMANGFCALDRKKCLAQQQQQTLKETNEPFYSSLSDSVDTKERITFWKILNSSIISQKQKPES